MNIQRRRALLLLLPTLTLLLGGCVTHTLLITLTGESPEITWGIEGDSLDVFDNRIQLPGNGWAQLEHKVGEDSSGNLVGSLLYQARTVVNLPHPISPMGETGLVDVRRDDGWFYDVTTVTVTFPSWKAPERYGDPDAHVPTEILALEESGLDTTLTPEGEEELHRIKARAGQLWTVDRYLRQMERLVTSELGADADSTVVRDAVSRFAPVVRAYVMSLQGDAMDPVDPQDVSLEWYPELRESMITAASEVTGLPVETMAAAADSLDEEYKRWVDLEDDTVQLALVMPDAQYRRLAPDPDEVSGDTLVWNVERERVADQQLQIVAAGYTFSLLPIALAGLLIGGVAGLIVRLSKRKR
ncbi:hypothetical protein KQI52_15470 [bacterium]|nr:hypothetical protein [bacterium]